MKKILFLLPLAALLFTGCSSDDNTPPEAPVEVVAPRFTEAEKEVADHMNDFGLEFVQGTFAQSNSDENLLVSPFSASMFLSMLANSVDNSLTSAVGNILGIENIADVNSFSSKCLAWLPNVNKLVKLNYANSVWYDKSFTINASFANAVNENYLADIFSRDFKSESVVADINNWASKQTNGKITEVVSNTPENLAILNALYFSGRWLEPFLRSRTVPETFNGTRGKSTVDMMKNDLFALYGHTDDAQMIRLYFKGYFFIDVIMPEESINIESFAADNMAAYWMKFTHYYKPYYVHLSFPKFEIKPKKAQINDVLKNLGLDNISISSILDNNNTDGTISIDQISTIRFDEDGAEAASVTDNGYSAPTNKEATMTIDRPFIFFICEPTTQQCLFAGKVTNL